MAQVNVVFQVAGGRPATLTVDEGTSLSEFLAEREVAFGDTIIVHNSTRMDTQKDAENVVLENNDIVYASRRRTHG